MRGPVLGLAWFLYHTARPPLRAGPTDRPERSRQGPLQAAAPLSREK